MRSGSSAPCDCARAEVEPPARSIARVSQRFIVGCDTRCERGRADPIDLTRALPASHRPRRIVYRANGKLLLFGEHAVVYGTPAIGIGLNVGVRVRFQPAHTTRLRVEAWGIDVAPDDDHRVAKALAAIVASLGDDARTGEVHVEPSVPPGAGLGSSAALAVGVARALVDSTSADDPRVYDAAMAAERVFHGNPSGLDHAAAMRGGAFRFVRGVPPSITKLEIGGSFELVVAQVAPGGDTAALVGGVHELRERHPLTLDALIGAIDSCVEDAIAAIASGNHGAVGELMNLNHGLLTALGVSTPALDAACSSARQAGALGAKLTGAGGGGCMVALVNETSLDAVERVLKDQSMMLFRTTLEAGE